MTEQLDLEDWLRDHSRQHPRQNGKSTLALNCIRLQEEVNEANYKTYAERVKNDLLRKENQQLKSLLKECQHMILAYSINHDTFTKEKVLDTVKQIDNAIGEKK